jgi:hypothetical protein
VGAAYEAGLAPAARKRGAHYTPPDVAATLVARALAHRPGGAPLVCDPACGGGVFLVAAADALAARGLDPRRIVDELLVGVDIDPGAVAVARESLGLWAAEHGAVGTPRVICADAFERLGRLDGAVDVVVGNPPFQSQLGRANARASTERERLVARFGVAASGYVDAAALFVLRGMEMVGDEGVVALVLPRSVLAARDAAGVRDEVVRRAWLAECWIPGERLFDASVDVVMPVLAVGAVPGATAVVTGRAADRPAGEVSAGELAVGTWSALHATALGVPQVVRRAAPRCVGEVASATAGFRDQYYGLVGRIHDEPAADGRWARLATTAMIDPGRCRWGAVAVRFGRRSWTSPHVDLDAVATADASVLAWVERLLVPKVMVATQTRVIEAVADPLGRYVPSTPLIAVVPRADGGERAGSIAAALLAPPASAWAHHRFGGGGLSPTALKLAAREVERIPLPVDRGPWDAATSLLDEASEGADGTDLDWPAIGGLLCDSWQLERGERRDVLRWWLERVL